MKSIGTRSVNSKSWVIFIPFLCALVLASQFTTANEVRRKFDLGLQVLGIQPESAPDYSSHPASAEVSQKEILSIIDAIDPDSELRKFMKLTSDRLEFFSEDLTSEIPGSPEYSIDLIPEGAKDSSDLITRLEKISNAVKSGAESKPLSGFRVLIDPGHMGDGGEWDAYTGKFVSVGGKTVSEGQIALWTGFLLASELESLGAEVRFTRVTMAPVAGDFSTYDPTPQIAQAMYKSSRSEWMKKLLQLPDSDFAKEIQTAPEVIKILDQNPKAYYLQADLDARSRIIDEFKPDLFVDIHFDANNTKKLQNKVNDVEIYVPGAARKGEFGSRNARARLLKHLTEVRRWKHSVEIAKLSALQVSKKLGIPPLKNAEMIPSSVLVEDGVLARNLFQTNRSVYGLTMFYECAHYDHVKEYPLMSSMDVKSSYRGNVFTHPSRLKPLSEAMRDGILDYFRQFKP